VAFRRQGPGLIVEPVDEVADGEEEVGAIRDAFEAETASREDIGAEPFIVLERVLIDHPGLFRRPVPPVSELFEKAGFEIDGGWVGRAGVSWKPPGVAMADRLRDRLRVEHQLNECCEEALEVVIDALSAQILGGDLDIRSVNRALGHGPVVEAFSEWVDEMFGLDSPSIGELADALAAPGRGDTAPALLLRARHHEATGTVLEAERDLESAVRLDPEYGPALAELAWYVSDRGDADRTVSLLRRAGLGGDDPMLAFHAGLGAGLPAVGRNEPCPCGSGRKYKVCHLGQVQVGAGERVQWLISKLTTFVTRPDREHGIYGLASSALLPDFEVGDLARMARDEFILELRVFEGGGVSEYLDSRGVLLPQDERDLLELWEMTRLGFWEVIGSDGESRSTVRDTRTGETLEVTDRSMAGQFEPGDQILARFLPGWGHNWPSGVALRIDLRHRDSLIALLDLEPDADEIARWYGGLFAPPSFANREGEPLVLCSARLKPMQTWDATTEILDGAYERDDETSGLWRELFDLNPDERIVRALIRRDGDELVVEANSETRLDRVLEQLAALAEVVTRETQPMRNPAELEAVSSDRPENEASTEPVDPELVAQIVDAIERRWLDEAVPALGGITPRQAVADPTRRKDLIALLRSFERMPATDAITMRPDVLRRQLGLADD
jgi:hypothetical protein